MLPTTVVIHEGDYDPLLGASFVQIGREGLGFQKTQNGGVTPPPPGPDNSAYYRFGSRVTSADHESSLFQGIDVSLGGIADLARGQDDAFLKQGLAALSADVDRAMKGFDARHPEAIAPILAELEAPDEFARRNAMSLRNTSTWNFFDCCAISLPLPKQDGQNVGLMLIARNGRDRRLFRVAASVEKAIGH